MNGYFFDVGAVVDLIKRAGEAIMDVYAQDFAVYEKADASPVTEADMGAEKIIFDGLRALTSDIPVVGEEHTAAGETADLTREYFWLVDPVDGTADFVKRNGEFTVNIALIRENAPVFGAVYVPVSKTLFCTQTPTCAVMEKDGETSVLKTRAVPAAGYTVLNSRTHCDTAIVARLLNGLKIAEQKPCGSSLKFCLIAAGQADVYPCSHRTKEWDTAAAHAVLRAAGGEVYDAVNNTVLTYRKPELKNPLIVSFGQKR